MRCGNVDFIRKALDNLRDLNHALLHSKYLPSRTLCRGGQSMIRALREQDGRIGLSVFARAGTSEPGKFVTEDNDSPFCVVHEDATRQQYSFSE